MYHAMINVLIVEDQEIIVEGIHRLLHNEPSITIVDQASHAKNLFHRLAQHKPNVILLNLQLQGLDAIETTKRIKRHDANIKVLILSLHASEVFGTGLMQAGANGYLAKGANKAELIRAIKTVHAGQPYLSQAIMDSFAIKKILTQHGSPFLSLSEREMQITLMITTGQKVDAIANALSLSPKTVNGYRYRVFEKLTIDSDVMLTHLALKHGLIDILG